VKESLGLFIAAEPRGDTTTLVGNSAILTFEIKTKNGAEAQHIADFLNKNIESISFTIFEDHPMFDYNPSGAQGKP
jgi:hypothetical protein